VGKPSMISDVQRKIIYASANKLGLVDKNEGTDPLHELIYSVGNVEHIKDLTAVQADMIINRLGGRSSGAGAKKKATTIREGMASEGQIKKMWALIFELQRVDPHESVSAKARLNGFIKKFAHVDDIRFLEKESANNIIEGLKNILRRAKDI